MTLAQMQARFFELKGKLAVGQITDDEFKHELERLRFQDGQGRWWMIGAQSGRWYYYDGARWLLGDPPETSATVGAAGSARETPPTDTRSSAEPDDSISTRYRYVPPPQPAPPTSQTAANPAPSPLIPPPSPPVKHSLGDTLRDDLTRVHMPQVHTPTVHMPDVRVPQMHIPPQVIVHAPKPIRRAPPNLILLGALILGLLLVALLWLAVDNLVPGKPISSFFGGPNAARTAVARATPSLVLGANNVDNLLRVGDELTAKSEFEPALEQYAAAAKYSPNDADVYTHWARALALTGRINEAVSNSQKATKLDPTSSKAFAEMTRALAWSGQTNPSVNAGEKATQLDPQNAAAFAFLSEAYLRAGRASDAQKAADTALELDDANPDSHRAAGWVAILAGRKDEGLSEWKRVLELAPDIFFYHYELGQIYNDHLNDPQNAIVEFQHATQLYPPYIPSHNALGHAYLAANQPVPAVLEFQKALTLDPNSSEAYLGLGLAFQASQRCPQAIPYFQKALEIKGDLLAADGGLIACGAVAKTNSTSAPPPQGTPGLQVVPTAVVEATVVPVTLATPAPKGGSSPAASAATASGSKGQGRIAFATYDGQFHLFTANPDGSDRQPVNDLASGPSFGPDGSQLLYHSWVSDQRGIHRIDAKGSNDAFVSRNTEDLLPSWSPDGTKYVYATRAGRGGDITKRAYNLLIGSPDTKPRQDPPPLLEQAQYPAWGPNGKIAFRDCGFPDDKCGLAVVNADGSQKVKIIPDNVNSTAPAWSRDGSKIIFMSDYGGNWDIYIVDSGGGSPARLTTDPAQDGLPAVSPDGKQIAFVSKRGGGWAIWAMGIDGSNQHKLFDIGGDISGDVPGNSSAQPGQAWWEQKISWQ